MTGFGAFLSLLDLLSNVFLSGNSVVNRHKDNLKRPSSSCIFVSDSSARGEN